MGWLNEYWKFKEFQRILLSFSSFKPLEATTRYLFFALIYFHHYQTRRVINLGISKEHCQQTAQNCLQDWKGVSSLLFDQSDNFPPLSNVTQRRKKKGNNETVYNCWIIPFWLMLHNVTASNAKKQIFFPFAVVWICIFIVGLRRKRTHPHRRLSVIN